MTRPMNGEIWKSLNGEITIAVMKEGKRLIVRYCGSTAFIVLGMNELHYMLDWTVKENLLRGKQLVFVGDHHRMVVTDNIVFIEEHGSGRGIIASDQASNIVAALRDYMKSVLTTELVNLA